MAHNTLTNSGETGTLRRIAPSDIPSALELSSQAEWNQTTRDWQTLIELEPEGCLAIAGENGLLATATLLCYEERLGWLGMVLTHKDNRRRGLARRLVTVALEFAAERGIKTVKLDATNQGQPLYESLGFRAEQYIERWSRPAALAKTRLSSQTGCWAIAEGLDRESFSADRSRLFASLRERGHLHTAEDGFVLTRHGSLATYLGPFIARSEGTAKRLIDECLEGEERACFWDLLPSNRHAVELAQETGFRRERSLVRMFRGPQFQQCSALTYGIAGFEFG